MPQHARKSPEELLLADAGFNKDDLGFRSTIDAIAKLPDVSNVYAMTTPQERGSYLRGYHIITFEDLTKVQARNLLSENGLQVTHVVSARHLLFESKRGDSRPYLVRVESLEDYRHGMHPHSD